MVETNLDPCADCKSANQKGKCRSLTPAAKTWYEDHHDAKGFLGGNGTCPYQQPVDIPIPDEATEVPDQAKQVQDAVAHAIVAAEGVVSDTADPSNAISEAQRWLQKLPIKDVGEDILTSLSQELRKFVGEAIDNFDVMAELKNQKFQIVWRLRSWKSGEDYIPGEAKKVSQSERDIYKVEEDWRLTVPVSGWVCRDDRQKAIVVHELLMSIVYWFRHRTRKSPVQVFPETAERYGIVSKAHAKMIDAVLSHPKLVEQCMLFGIEGVQLSLFADRSPNKIWVERDSAEGHKTGSNPEEQSGESTGDKPDKPKK